MKYSFNRNKNDIIFAHTKDINASYKDLSAVCDSVRYKNAAQALSELEDIFNGKRAVLYRRHNRRMGSRHELGGKLGRYPMKSAGIIKKTLLNAMANARNKGLEPDIMFVVHASANKTQIAQRSPSKGVLYMGAGYGYATARRSDLEFAKVEIGLAKGTEIGLSKNMKGMINSLQNTKAQQKLESAASVSKTQKQKSAAQDKMKEKPKTPDKASSAATANVTETAHEHEHEHDQSAQNQQKRQQPKVAKKPKEGMPPQVGQ